MLGVVASNGRRCLWFGLNGAKLLPWFRKIITKSDYVFLQEGAPRGAYGENCVELVERQLELRPKDFWPPTVARFEPPSTSACGRTFRKRSAWHATVTKWAKEDERKDLVRKVCRCFNLNWNVLLASRVPILSNLISLGVNIYHYVFRSCLISLQIILLCKSLKFTKQNVTWLLQSPVCSMCWCLYNSAPIVIMLVWK